MTAPARPEARVTMRDDTLPHQIRLTFTRNAVTQIAVSCTCRATGNGNAAGNGYRPITARARWDDPGEPLRIWQQHMAQVGPVTRDDLEAVIRRALADIAVAADFRPTRNLTEVMNRAAEEILKSADAYGLAEFGIAADRRRAALADVVGDGSYGGTL